MRCRGCRRRRGNSPDVLGPRGGPTTASRFECSPTSRIAWRIIARRSSPSVSRLHEAARRGFRRRAPARVPQSAGRDCFPPSSTAIGFPYVLAPNGTAPRIERLRGERAFDAAVGRRIIDRADRVLAVSDTEQRDLAALGVAATSSQLFPIRSISTSCDAVERRTIRTRRFHGLSPSFSSSASSPRESEWTC